MHTHDRHDRDHDHGHDAGPGCSGHAPNSEELAAASSDDVTECVVMPGTPVITSQAEADGLYRDYRGERYWFCCDACGPLFDADPDEYAGAA